MKRSAMLCALGVTLAALGLASSGAFGAIINNSKSNNLKAIDPHNAAAVKACTDGGGTVGKDPKGKDVCITPKKQ